VARISSFLYAESIVTSITPDGIKPTIVGPMQIINLAFIPSSYSFAIILGLQDFDRDKAHKLRIEFVSVNNETLYSASTESFAEPTNNNGNGLFNSFACTQLSIDLRNVVFLNEGTYTTKIWFDNELLGDYPIFVGSIKDDWNANVNARSEQVI